MTQEAERNFRDAIRLYHPGSGVPQPDPRLDYGAFLLREGRTQDALDMLQQSVTASPGSPRAHAELGRAGCLKQLGSGLVLTGGGAKLGGLAPLAEQTLEMPVRVGVPQGLDKMGEILPDAGYSAVVGLVIYGNRLLLMRGPSDKGLVGKLWGALRGKN